MKKVFTILAAVLITASVFAQTPEKVTYQAVVRDGSNTLITSTQVGIEINIYQSSASGTLVYTETQTPTTNVNGLLSIEIGGQTGFDLIDWANGPYFIETNIDVAGGTNYTITGVSQLLTVPYALHAKTAETITGGITETDPVFTGSEANNITSADITNLSNLSGKNTGDQDISGVAINTQAIQDTANQIRVDFPDVSGFVSTETDPVYSAWNKSYNDLTNKPNIVDTVSAVIDTTTQFVRTEVDGSVTNEIQTISRTGLTVTLSNGGGTYQDSINVYTAGDGIDITNNVISEHKYQVGDFAQGGIIFWVDETGEHGLVCAKTDQSTEIRWYAGTNGYTQAKGDGPYAGKANTIIIIAAQVAIGNDGNTYAARICNELQISEEGKTYGDWYLPAKEEVNLMYQNKTIIDATATANGGSAFFCPHGLWSSTEDTNNNAWRNGFNGAEYSTTKDFQAEIRAIRSF